MSDTDWIDGDFVEPGYYRVWYRRGHKPAGAYRAIHDLAVENNLSDYPDDGMIVYYDGDDEISLVPSLNPDDLVMSEIKQRLEYLRHELRAERISYGELAELQDLAEHIDDGDVELLEAAGVPEGER